MKATEVKAFFERVAGDWDTMRLGYYDEQVIEKMAEVSGVDATSEVADVGTGTGFVAAGTPVSETGGMRTLDDSLHPNFVELRTSEVSRTLRFRRHIMLCAEDPAYVLVKIGGAGAVFLN